MQVLITGSDGYLGFPLSLHLLSRGHNVIGVDNLSRRRRVREMGSWSATPIASPFERFRAIAERYENFDLRIMDLRNAQEVDYVFDKYRPDACVHLGEIPSAAYSMIDRDHCNETMMNNIVGTNNILYAMHKYAPNCHLVKLGTMGEYGTPNIDIPEGYFEVEYRGRKDYLPFPRQGGSFYHQTKIHDTHNIMFACKIWQLRSTDIMQGVVHGIVSDEIVEPRLLTRFDFDECFGTAINRFCVQAIIGHELTPYGKGGQTRGYIALQDSIQCMRIVVENPPDTGVYRTLNQFDECYSINDLADHVVKAAAELGIDAKIWSIENPRIEAEEHYYNPDHSELHKMGFKPTNSLEDELKLTLRELIPYKERIEAKKNRILPTIRWRE